MSLDRRFCRHLLARSRLRVYHSCMPMISDTASLAAFCQRLKTASFITVDTEFMREKTYWPILCLVQLGGPDEARAIDPLAPAWI